MDWNRIAFSCIGTMAVSFILLACWAYLAPQLPVEEPPTTAASILGWISAVSLWPMVVAALMMHHDPEGVFIPLLWIASGLFWAFVIELILIVVAKVRKARQHTPLTPA